MLRVPTVVAPSAIEGVGLFATSPIPAGTLIWEFTHGVDWRIPADDLPKFPEPYRTWLMKYLYREPSGLYVLCGDAGKYMNHSYEPNCDDLEGPTRTIARRDIAAGEELTSDYRLFDLDSQTNGRIELYR